MVAERKAPYIQGQEALSILPRLIEESVIETQGLQRQFVDFRPDILSWHKKTERYNYVYGQTQRLKRITRKPREIDALRNNFAGVVFQDIAYSFCALEYDKSVVLLSPENTSEFWTMLYPYSNVVVNPFGKKALENIYVPDGILVDRQRYYNTVKSPVLKLFEYTLVRMDENDLEKQLRSIRIQQKRYPNLFRQASIEFVTPITFLLPRLRGQEGGIKFLQLPFTRDQFGRFTRNIFDGMK